MTHGKVTLVILEIENLQCNAKPNSMVRIIPVGGLHKMIYF
jgi:hypothetical protein